jgi:hypothetical protein
MGCRNRQTSAAKPWRLSRTVNDVNWEANSGFVANDFSALKDAGSVNNSDSEDANALDDSETGSTCKTQSSDRDSHAASGFVDDASATRDAGLADGLLGQRRSTAGSSSRRRG